MDLRDDEQPPQLVAVDQPRLVMWSSLWASRPDVLVRFDVAAERGGEGTDLAGHCW